MSRFTPSLLGRSLRRASAVASSSASTFVRPTVSARPSRAFFASTPSRLAEETRSPHQGDGAFSAGPSPKEHDELVHAGTTAVELGDMAEASRCYAAALEISRSAGVLFNLGVVQYCLKQHDAAISSWLECIALDPENSDAHTNLASAYILSSPSKAPLAEKHLRAAQRLNPLDPEISFNLAAVLEARGQLREALDFYERARGLGVERAEQNVRAVGAKIAAAAAGDAGEEKQ